MKNEEKIKRLLELMEAIINDKVSGVIFMAAQKKIDEKEGGSKLLETKMYLGKDVNGYDILQICHSATKDFLEEYSKIIKKQQ